MAALATLSAIPYTSSVCAGEELQVQVVVGAPESPINASQGVLHFDASVLEVTSISTGGSVFRFWQTSPVVNTEQGTVSFAGGLPTPGYQGEGGLLFTMIVRPKMNAENQTLLSWDKTARVLLNDGYGTSADLSLNDVRVDVSDPSAELCDTIPTKPAAVPDTVSPEPFEVIITKSDQGFQGEYFASFYAYDAGSGIVRYELRENGEPWHTEQSPYVLHVRQGQVLLEVKAVDASGNERISSASALLQDGSGVYLGPWWFWLILLCAVAAAIWRLFRHKISSSVTEKREGALDSIAASMKSKKIGLKQ